MAGNAYGVLKASAKRLGVSVAEYSERVLLGDKWCHRCRAWRAREAFGRDTSRADGLDAKCQQCRISVTDGRPGKAERATMRADGFAWCRDCRCWFESRNIRGGRCALHRRLAEQDRYASDNEHRYRRKRHSSMRRRGVDAVPPDGMEHLESVYSGSCVYCGDPATSIDHMEPVSRGGRTTPGNVVPACRSCNSRKRDKPLDAWLDELQARGPLSEGLLYALEFRDTSLYG